jgi:uncharacterized protein YggT (Ycf19 family)
VTSTPPTHQPYEPPPPGQQPYAAHATYQAEASSAPAESGTSLWILRLARAVVVFVYAVVILDLVLLILAFSLRLLGASTDAEFTRWVYRSVERIMEPFRGIFPSPAVGGESVVDFSLLFAMIIYTILALALHTLVMWLADRLARATRRNRLAHAGAGHGAPPEYPGVR